MHLFVVWCLVIIGLLLSMITANSKDGRENDKDKETRVKNTPVTMSNNLENLVLDLKTQLDKQKKRLDELENQVKTQNQSQNQNQSRSGNSNEEWTYIWKISGVAKKLAMGQVKDVEYEYSEPFYTGPYGYKLQAFVDWDGEGSRKHLSVFMRILPSDYDRILDWPFNLPIALIIRHQHSPSQNDTNIVGRLTAKDLTHQSFEMPGKEPNMGYGWPSFIAHDALMRDSYIQEDAMFIQVKVDRSYKSPN